MFLHRYVDPEALRMWSCDKSKKKSLLWQLYGEVLLGRRRRVDFPIRLRSESIYRKEIAHTPRKALILITLPSTRCQHPVGKDWKIIIHFCSIYLWNSHPLILKSCGKTPGDWIDDEMAVSKNKGSKFSPNKKEWEGGPGMLSNGNLIKNCRHNFHKAYKIA